MKKVKILLFAILLSTGCLLLVPSGKAQASSDNILRKWTRINTYECIVDNKLLHSPVSQKKDNGSIRTSAVLDLVVSYSTNWILTPSYNFGGTTPGSSVACRYVIDGSSSKYNGMTNLLTYGGKTSLSGVKWNDSNPSKVEELLTLLDYVGEETEGGGGRFSIVAHRSTETCQTTIWTSCSTSESETSTVGITVTRNDDGTLHYQRDSGNFWSDLQVSFKDHNIILEAATGLTCTGGGKLEEPLQGDLNTMYSNLADRLTNTTWTVSCTTTTMAGTFATTTQSTIKYTFGVSDKVVDSSEISQYIIKDQPISVANKVNSNLTGGSLRAFTNTEKYELYDYYLNKAIVTGGAVANRKTCNPTSTTNLQPVKLLDTSDNTFKTCYVNLGTLDADSTKVNAPNDSYTKIIEISIADVISRLDHLNTSDIDIAEITGVSPSDDPYNNPLPGDPDPGGDGSVVNCSNSTSLGWILCTGIELIGGVTEHAYDYIAKNFLTVDARYIDNENTVDAWKVFQGFANTIFAILFIIVIFSQLTGFGLSNYGIKKALPKLIVVAVLVNLSYIIGAVAIDLSNLLGEGLKTMFVDLANNFKVTDGAAFNFSAVTSAILSFILTGVGGGLIVFGAFNWDLWLPMFLLVLLGMVFSIVFFFIILAVRQAGVIILLVMAPVAIVCYALPNTKTIFERWKKMFISLLVVYPICGALMGGGTFASSLLLAASGNSSGFFYNLVAMLIQVIPFFFVPTLVRSSMMAMGSIGNRITNFGRGLSKGTTGAIRKSDGFRRFQTGTQNLAMKGGQLREKVRNKLQSKGRLGKVASYVIPGVGGIGAAYRASNLPGAEARRRAYDRKVAKRTRAVTAQMDSDLRDSLTAKRGTEVAKANANQALREDYSKAYQRDIDFMTDTERQKKELIEALNAVEVSPEDPNNVARLRAVQDIMSKSDEGQTEMQRVYNRRLWVEQEAAKREGRNAKVSEGMRTAAANLMNDHPELKGMNRGFFSMLTKMKNKAKPEEVFEKGEFEAKTYTGADGKPVFERDANGNLTVPVIGNDYFDAMGGFKYDPQSIANAGESALQRLASSIGKTLPDGTMSMTPGEAEAIYRSATEAITSKSIQVKPENERYLNDIRKAAYNTMQTNFTAQNAKNFYDKQGREYKFDQAANDYVRQDPSGIKRFKKDTMGNLVSGTGSAIERINKNKLMSASDKFERDFGRYQDVHAPLHVRH